MFFSSIFYVIVPLHLSLTLGHDSRHLPNGVYAGNDTNGVGNSSKVEGTAEGSIERSSSRATTPITEDNEQPRDKRALGVIFQGIAEALGYTVSPVSLSSLPNPNATVAAAGAAPATVFTLPSLANLPPIPPAAPTRPQKPNPPGASPQRSAAAPSGATTASPRQRETLRLTGVVNFGNNSDLLGHLQQYERIFHGGATTTAAPPPSGPTPSVPLSKPCGPPKLGLTRPYFVKIPLPIAPNLSTILPLTAPRKVQQTRYKESSESRETTDEKDVRRDPPQGQRDTYIDEPEWMKKQRDDRKNKHREDEGSEEAEEEDAGPQGHRELAEYEKEDSRTKEDDEDEEGEREIAGESDEPDHENVENENEDREDPRERYEAKKMPPTEDSKKSGENDRENDSEDEEEGNERDDDQSLDDPRGSNPRKNQLDVRDHATLRNNFTGNEEPFVFPERVISPVPEDFGARLPIRVLDLPYNSDHGELRNSYGQSLQQDGRIDESLADYFERYKHPDTGLYDSQKIINFETLRKREPWWQDSYDSYDVGGSSGDPLERIRQEYGEPAGARYEEYELEDAERGYEPRGRERINDGGREKVNLADEEAEPTMTTYARIRAPETMKEYEEDKENEEERQDESMEFIPRRINENERYKMANPLPFQGFDFIKYNPYYRPLQISYEPEKLQRTADRILSYHNFGKYGTTGTSENDERKNEGPTASPLFNDEFIRNNYYIKPVQYVYEPEKLQRTADRILSYRNSMNLKQGLKKVNQETEEKDEEEQREADDSSGNLKEDESDDDESVEIRATKSPRGNDGAKGEPETNEPLENLRDRGIDEDEPEVERSRESTRQYEEENGEEEVDRYEEDSGQKYREKPEVTAGSSEDSRENSEAIDYEPEVNVSSKNLERDFNDRPEVGLPERLTGKKLHEGEGKEFQAWPAPFDYTFDSTQSTEIVKEPNYSKNRPEPASSADLAKYSKTSRSNRHPAGRISPTKETPSNVESKKPPTTGSDPPDSDISPTYESSVYETLASYEQPGSHSHPSARTKNIAERKKTPQQRREHSLPKDNENEDEKPRSEYRRVAKKKSRDEYSRRRPEVHVSEEARGFSARQRDEELPKPEATMNYNNRGGRRHEISTESFPVKQKTFEDPKSAHEFFELSQDDYDVDGRKFKGQKSEGNEFSTRATPGGLKNNELIGLLIVKQEDPNYQRDVNLTEFTDEPETDTEKVRVKEYRNKIATIKVSERKQLSPEGIVQLVGFTRNFQ